MRADENRVGLARKDHQATAKNAALAIRPKSGTQRARVLAVIEGAGAFGATREELADRLGLPDNSVRPRVKELIDAGFVEASEDTRPTRTGSSSEVVKATPPASGQCAINDDWE